MGEECSVEMFKSRVLTEMENPTGAILFCLAILSIIYWIIVICIHIIAICFGKSLLYKFQPSKSKDLPGVTILKPLVGLDGNTEVNLKSFFNLNYPDYEILFCVPSPTDSAVNCIKKLMAEYPNVKASLFTKVWNVGVNPKINNMMQGYSVAKNELVWICDSSIIVQPDSLSEMVSKMAPNVALVHQLPFVSLGTTTIFADCLEKVYFGTQHARIYLFCNFFGLYCANGMSSLIKKKILDDLGGLQAFSNYIAEDYHMGKTFWQKGYKIAMSSEVVLQNSEVRSLTRFKDRMIRWTRLRVTMEPFPQLLEPLTECLGVGLLAAFGFNYLFDVSFISVLTKHILAWFTFDQILLSIVNRPHQKLPSFPKRSLAWLLRETWTFLIFFQAVFGRQVIAWRTGEFHLSLGGKARLIENKLGYL